MYPFLKFFNCGLFMRFFIKSHRVNKFLLVLLFSFLHSGLLFCLTIVLHINIISSIFMTKLFKSSFVKKRDNLQISLTMGMADFKLFASSCSSAMSQIILATLLFLLLPYRCSNIVNAITLASTSLLLSSYVLVSTNKRARQRVNPVIAIHMLNESEDEIIISTIIHVTCILTIIRCCLIRQ